MRKIIWVFTLVYMAFIFYMSSRSIEESRLDSARLMETFGLVDQEEDALNIGEWDMFSLHNAVRKNAHLIIFAGLGMLFFVSVYGYFGKVWISGVVATLLTAFYGATDEFHQIFTHRGAAWRDVWLDTLGGLAGIAVVGVVFLIIEKNIGIKTFLGRIYDFEPKKMLFKNKQQNDHHKTSY